MFDQNQQNQFGYYGPAPMMQPNAYYNPGNIQQQKIPNVLSAEEIKQLQQQSNNFNLGLTSKEAMQAACNHRSLDGTKDSLTYDYDTGKARCTICGYEFVPIEPTTTYDDIMRTCDDIVNIIQTVKLLWPDMSDASQREFYNIIPLIYKVPRLFEFAAKNFNRNEFDLWSQQNSPAGMAMLQNLGNILGANQQFMGNPTVQYNGYGVQPPMMGQPQPMMNPMGGAPMGQVVQPQAPMMGQPVPGMNPFGFDGASQVQQPMTAPNQGYAYVPQAAATPVQPTVTAPAAPVQPEAAAPEETVTKQVTI